ADAVVRHMEEQGITPVAVEKVESLTGLGIQATYQGETYYVGNLRLLEKNGITLPNALKAEISRMQEAAKTVILFTNQQDLLAIVSITDKIKESSALAIKKLQTAGIEVYMLTGDNIHTAAAIAREVGIKNYKAEV
ncbi:HAD-IC family P-type ATPase, partial [Flavihumibacter sediminis]|nr:HAD-IC family P-type ATPase [Flavihumibacter sediminis]